MKKETKYLFRAISINLLVALLLFYAILGFSVSGIIDFILDFPLNLSVGIGTFYITGYFIGNILSKTKRVRIYHGILSAFVILLIGTMAGSTVGFVEEGLPRTYATFDYSLSQKIKDYYIKPLFWVFLFGFTPTLILGIILGSYLKANKAVD